MKETHYKLKHRVTALFAAAVMLCSMLPGAAFAEEPTPQPTEETVQMEQQTEPSETDNGQTDESSPDPGEDVTEATPEAAEEQPAEEEIPAAVVGAELYTDLPNTHIKRYIDQGIPPICHCLPVSLNQHWVVPFKYTNGSGWDSNRDRFSNQCHRTDTNWQVNATKRACLSGRGYCPNAVHQPAGSLYTVQHNNGFPCAAYRYFDPSQQGQL